MSLDFRFLHDTAHAAGLRALRDTKPKPMVVVNDRAGAEDFWVADGGVCGFAWVSFAGNTAWGRWAKKNGIASKHYPSGLSIWVYEGGQSLARKEAYAYAYAAVLRQAGVDAYAGSRMD